MGGGSGATRAPTLSSERAGYSCGSNRAGVKSRPQRRPWGIECEAGFCSRSRARGGSRREIEERHSAHQEAAGRPRHFWEAARRTSSPTAPERVQHPDPTLDSRAAAGWAAIREFTHRLSMPTREEERPPVDP